MPGVQVGPREPFVPDVPFVQGDADVPAGSLPVDRLTHVSKQGKHLALGVAAHPREGLLGLRVGGAQAVHGAAHPAFVLAVGLGAGAPGHRRGVMVLGEQIEVHPRLREQGVVPFGARVGSDTGVGDDGLWPDAIRTMDGSTFFMAAA